MSTKKLQGGIITPRTSSKKQVRTLQCWIWFWHERGYVPYTAVLWSIKKPNWKPSEWPGTGCWIHMKQVIP